MKMFNIHINKFSWVPYENILTRTFCQIEIAVHILLVKQVLATYISILLQKQLNAVRPM